MIRRAKALLNLLRASGIDATAAYDLQLDCAGIPAGTLYATSDGAIWRVPHRAASRVRGYVACLEPGTPEATAYIGLAEPVTLPTVPFAHPDYLRLYRAKITLKKK